METMKNVVHNRRKHDTRQDQKDQAGKKRIQPGEPFSGGRLKRVYGSHAAQHKVRDFPCASAGAAAAIAIRPAPPASNVESIRMICLPGSRSIATPLELGGAMSLV